MRFLQFAVWVHFLDVVNPPVAVQQEPEAAATDDAAGRLQREADHIRHKKERPHAGKRAEEIRQRRGVEPLPQRGGEAAGRAGRIAGEQRCEQSAESSGERNCSRVSIRLSWLTNSSCSE